MREVMTNLLNNAIDAVTFGGRVEISTGRRNNGWPYVIVADNGPGVSDDNRHHLFEPHFTTKEGGTGLGLFMSYGIVREHHGQLTYEGGSRAPSSRCRCLRSTRKRGGPTGLTPPTSSGA